MIVNKAGCKCYRIFNFPRYLGEYKSNNEDIKNYIKFDRFRKFDKTKLPKDLWNVTLLMTSSRKKTVQLF